MIDSVVRRLLMLYLGKPTTVANFIHMSACKHVLQSACYCTHAMSVLHGQKFLKMVPRRSHNKQADTWTCTEAVNSAVTPAAVFESAPFSG